LDLFDRHEIKISSFMIGEAVWKRPDLAAEIVHRGHEAGAHGRTWTPSYLLSKEEEKAFIQDNVQTIKRVTGFQPVGWNANWMRNSASTLEILQDLGFIYHIDDPSADEPFILPLRGKPFVTVPYTLHMKEGVKRDRSYKNRRTWMGLDRGWKVFLA
jgi:peptidoglycan/xylan/chitin deacetylase (PgdA/CDA1 family)